MCFCGRLVLKLTNEGKMMNCKKIDGIWHVLDVSGYFFNVATKSQEIDISRGENWVFIIS